MAVRAKMCCTTLTKGEHGSQMFMSAVYEGSTELQKISENAIFGDATPCGNLHLSGALPEGFEEREEYYLDLAEAGSPARDGEIVEMPARKVFRSAFDPNFPASHIVFRFALGDGDIRGELDMSIANPAAIEMLDGETEYRFAVRLARYRAGAEEIAIREKMLADMEECWGKEWDKPEPVGDHWRKWAWRSIDQRQDSPKVSREEYVAHYTRDLRRKLAIARGDVVDGL